MKKPDLNPRQRVTFGLCDWRSGRCSKLPKLYTDRTEIRVEQSSIQASVRESDRRRNPNLDHRSIAGKIDRFVLRTGPMENLASTDILLVVELSQFDNILV